MYFTFIRRCDDETTETTKLSPKTPTVDNNSPKL